MSEIATQGAALREFSPVEIMRSPQAMQTMVAFAEQMSKAHGVVPKHLHNKPADCFAIAMQAARWGMDPFVVASKTSQINGNLCYEAQLVVAVLKGSGAVRGRPHYEYKGSGEDMECRVGFVPAGEVEVVWGEWLCMRSVKTRNSPLWLVNPRQQMGYLQGRNWARLYAPDALLGVHTDDEMVGAEPIAPRPAINMGAADVVKPTELPPYDTAKFARNLPAWSTKIEDGERTPQQLIDWLKSGARLTQDQIDQINAIKPRPVVDADTGEIDAD